MLFPLVNQFETISSATSDYKTDNPILTEADENDSEKYRAITPTPTIHTINSEASVDTPVNRKMIAIESELEKDVSMLQERLGSKNKDLMNIEQELAYARRDLDLQKEESTETKKMLRVAQRRIE